MKLLNATVLAILLAVSAPALIPANAQAYLLLEGAAGMTPANGPWANGIGSIPVLESAAWVGLCLVTLPFCLLDEQSNGSSSVTTVDLIANGYSAEQIKLIEQDQVNLSMNLLSNNMKLEIRSTDTKASVESQIKSVYSDVSQTYLDLATSSAGLK